MKKCTIYQKTSQTFWFSFVNFLHKKYQGIKKYTSKVLFFSSIFRQLVFEMEGFDIKLEGMFGGQVIPLLSVDGSIQGEVRNWSSAVSQSSENV